MSGIWADLEHMHSLIKHGNDEIALYDLLPLLRRAQYAIEIRDEAIRNSLVRGATVINLFDEEGM